MAEYSANVLQTVTASGAVVFTESPQPCTRGLIYHRDESGLFRLASPRVLGVSCTADDLETAVERAYAAADEVKWDGMICRRDIGKRALRILNKGE